MTHDTFSVHIDTIRVGDAVERGGVMVTVCRKDIKSSVFMGTTLFGDSYRCGTLLVKKQVSGRRVS
jgi:hypothetical protein